MSLTEFIQTHHGKIISGFERFARTLMPVGSNMSPSELRDHAEELLTAIVVDMDTPQTRNEESQKGKGLGIEQKMLASGNLHAVARLGHRFTLVTWPLNFVHCALLFCDCTSRAVEPNSVLSVASTNQSTKR